MAPYTSSRRDWLRRIGASAAVGLGGCLGESDPQADLQRSSSPAPTTAHETSTPEPTDWPIETPSTIGDQPYVPFSPVPEETSFPNGYPLMSVQPAVAAANRVAFGDAFGRFMRRWGQNIGWSPLEKHDFTVWIQRTTAVIADFDQAAFKNHLERYPMENVSTYHDFDLYAGTVNGISHQVVGVGEGTIYTVSNHDTETGRNRIEYLIDLQRDAKESYFETTARLARLVDQLPQGVFTAVYPELEATNHWLKDHDVAAMGETLLFDTDRSPATGRAVFQFPDSVNAPRENVDEILSDRDELVRLPLTDPVIREPADGMVAVEDAVDPEAVF